MTEREEGREKEGRGKMEKIVKLNSIDKKKSDILDFHIKVNKTLVSRSN